MAGFRSKVSGSVQGYISHLPRTRYISLFISILEKVQCFHRGVELFQTIFCIRFAPEQGLFTKFGLLRMYIHIAIVPYRLHRLVYIRYVFTNVIYAVAQLFGLLWIDIKLMQIVQDRILQYRSR